MHLHSRVRDLNLLSAYAGKILRVNLSAAKAVRERLPADLVREYVGGKGVGTRLLFDEVKAGIDPLGPENKLFFATGPATGTLVPHKGYFVSFKSPLTNIYGNASSGGAFGDELKQAGYDVLIIEGRAEKPVYLWIDDDRLQIKDAGHLWGKDTFETNVLIKEELGSEEIKVARIGPAGEKLVKIASIVNDYSRTAARCGVGAVMGSKNLKAIAVQGTGSVEVAKVDELLNFLQEYYKTIREKTTFFQEWGTLGMFNLTNVTGVNPTRYWRKGTFDEYEKINGQAIKREIEVKNKACYSCVIACSKLCAVKEGEYAGAVVEGPEHETVYALGSLCENSNLASIAKANELCDRLGMDTMSTGNVIAFAMECYDRGIITVKDTEGIALVWGNHQAVVQMVKKIATRSGLGDVLAEGVKGAAKKLGKGTEKFAVHVKGLEPAGYDPRGLTGMALAFAIADRGACHMPATMYHFDINGILDRLSYDGKAAFLQNLSERHVVSDALALCRFSRDVFPWEILVKYFELLMGIETNETELKRIGERIITLARAFNVREGISRKDDMLPERFFKESLPNGPALKKDKFNKMLDEYYDLMGWDRDGIPTEKRLTEIGLADIIPQIGAFGKKAEERANGRA